MIISEKENSFSLTIFKCYVSYRVGEVCFCSLDICLNYYSLTYFFDSVRRTYVAYAFNSLAERSRTNLSNSASEYLLDHDENWLLMRTHGEVDKFLYYTYVCAESNV